MTNQYIRPVTLVESYEVIKNLMQGEAWRAACSKQEPWTIALKLTAEEMRNALAKE
jgi:hypothetical protein